MFERFTKEARATVIAAQHVARDAGSRTVDTRHVLVALAESTGHNSGFRSSPRWIATTVTGRSVPDAAGAHAEPR